MTHAHTRIIASLGFFALLGFGCEAPKEGREGAQNSKNATAEVGTESPTPSDGEPVVSGEGKVVFESEVWKTRLEVPKNWWYSASDADSDKLYVVFNPTPIPTIEVGDAIPAVDLIVRKGSLKEALDNYGELDYQQETILVDGFTVHQISYDSELVGGKVREYFVENGGSTYRVSGLMTQVEVYEILQNIIQHWKED